MQRRPGDRHQRGPWARPGCVEPSCLQLSDRRDHCLRSLPGTSRNRGRSGAARLCLSASVRGPLPPSCLSPSAARQVVSLVRKSRITDSDGLCLSLSVYSCASFTLSCLKFFICRMEIILKIKQARTTYLAQSPAKSSMNLDHLPSSGFILVPQTQSRSGIHFVELMSV